MQVLPVKIRVLIEDRFQNVKSTNTINFFLWVQAHHVSNNNSFKPSAAYAYNKSFKLLSTKKWIDRCLQKLQQVRVVMKSYIPLLSIWLV